MMAESSMFRPPHEMKFDGSHGKNLSDTWRIWREEMELYLDVAMPDKSDKEKAKAFLYIIGQQGREIYRTMEFTTEAKDRTIKELLDKFNGYCNPKKNVTVERQVFYEISRA